MKTGAPLARKGERVGFSGWIRRGVVAGTLSASLVGAGEIRAEESRADVKAPDPVKTVVTEAAGVATNGVVSVRVPIPDPVMARPSTLVLAEMASRENQPLVNRPTQESIEGGLRESLRPRTVEEAGSAGRWVKRDKSLRAIGQLFDPFAPLPKPYRDAAPAFEQAMRGEEFLPGSLRGPAAPSRPRTFIDERTHEYGLRLW